MERSEGAVAVAVGVTADDADTGADIDQGGGKGLGRPGVAALTLCGGVRGGEVGERGRALVWWE